MNFFSSLLSCLLIICVHHGVHAQTSLANGWVLTRTNVSSSAGLPSDIHLMAYSLASGDPQTASSIYSFGKTSRIVVNGVSRNQSLESLSRFTEPFVEQSFYNLHRYGLAGGLTNRTKNYNTFGDDFVQSTFQQYNRNSAHATMPAEAALILVLYPYLVSKTLSAVSYCERYGKQDPAQELVSSLENSISSFDQAFAYYVGNDQVIGSSTTGYSFYSLAEKANLYFSLSSENDISSAHAGVNSNVRALFQEAYKYYSFPDACTAGSQTAAQLHGVVQRFIAQTQVSLVQMLIHSMATKDLNRTKMYATSIVPQVIRCKPSVYRSLKASLLDKDYDPQKFVSILEDLQQIYSCLGFTCEDIGSYNNLQTGLVLGQCTNRQEVLSIVGYAPETDIYELSKIDLDILEIKCYLTLNLFNPARQIYEYGHNSYLSGPGDLIVQYRTLQSMATSTERSIAKPYYEMFESYNKDPDYADAAVMDAMLGRNRFADASYSQRTQIILGTLSYQVVYMDALSQCSTAMMKCELGDLNSAAHYWDGCAAGLVGSLEGQQLGGSKSVNDGVLLYTLANVVAEPMGRANQDYYAIINSKIVDALWSGKGLLLAGKCSTAEHIADEMFQYTLVPLMQAVMLNAYLIQSAEAPYTNTNGNLGDAESITRAILPVVCNFSDEDCKTLSINMLMEDGKKPVLNGTIAVANALKHAIFVQSPYRDISCQDVGGLNGVDTCQYVNALQRQSSMSNSFVNKRNWLRGIVWAVALAAAIVV